MPERTETRFGIGGELVPDGPNSTARWHYLEAVCRVVPKAVEDLAALADDRSVPLEHDRFRRAPGVPYRDQRFRDWAKQWGFTDPRLMRHARSYARWWRQCPTYRGRFMGQMVTYFEPEFPTFANPDWNPFEETEAAYRARFDRYIEAVKQTPGTASVPTKRNMQHFEWLALTQVGGLRPSEIAERYQSSTGIDESTIRKRVAETAALCGIKLDRKLPPGRPRKIRT